MIKYKKNTAFFRLNEKGTRFVEVSQWQNKKGIDVYIANKYGIINASISFDEFNFIQKAIDVFNQDDGMNKNTIDSTTSSEWFDATLEFPNEDNKEVVCVDGEEIFIGYYCYKQDKWFYYENESEATPQKWKYY